MKKSTSYYRLLVLSSLLFLLFSACIKGVEHQWGKHPHPGSNPTITSYSPVTAGLGDTVTVYGKNLPTDTAGISITINKIPLTILQAAADSLKVVFTKTTGSGPVVLTIGGQSYTGPSFTYTYQAVVTTVAGTGTVGRADGPAGQASFYCPWGIVADANGDLYIAESYNRLIRKIRAADSTVSTIPINTFDFASPYNIALDTLGHNLYVTDFNQHVMKVYPNGNETVIYTGVMPLAGIGIGHDGYLYVSNNTYGTILRMDTSGMDTTLFASNLVTPRNIIFDKDGNLYVPAYSGESVIYKITPSGSASIAAGDPNFGGWEIARDMAGNFYEADHFSNVIRKIDPAGTVTTIAGSGVAADVDGIGLQASFNGPQGLTIDKQGNLYVTTFNYDNNTGNKVRKISFQ